MIPQADKQLKAEEAIAKRWRRDADQYYGDALTRSATTHKLPVSPAAIGKIMMGFLKYWERLLREDLKTP